jgi:AbrB family looped-hinge helix DNA binding protein
MALARSKLTAQGQISVPVEVRRKLGVGPGSVIEWEQVADAMIVRRAGTYSSHDLHAALFPKAPRTRALDELKQGRALYVRRRHASR